MAAVGRGRGRGRGLLARELSNEDAPKQVGGGDLNGKVIENGISGKNAEESVKEIQGCLDRLTLDVSDEEISNIYELAESASASDEHLKKMADILYEKCVSDREFAKTGAYICDKLTGIEANGTKFRSCLLSKIQADFKEKESHRKNISTFLNNFSFMCQVFGVMRTAGGEVFKPLVSPLYDYISLIVDSKEASNDEFECLNEQLQSIGQDLEQNDREKMEVLMEKVRNLIIRKDMQHATSLWLYATCYAPVAQSVVRRTSNSGDDLPHRVLWELADLGLLCLQRSSPPIRCALLELFECHCRGWKDLQNDITRFYCDTMMDIITD